MRKVLRGASVRRVKQAAVVDAGAPGARSAIAVVPLARDGRLLGLDVQCGCGGHVLIECVYEEEACAAAVANEPDERS